MEMHMNRQNVSQKIIQFKLTITFLNIWMQMQHQKSQKMYMQTNKDVNNSVPITQIQ